MKSDTSRNTFDARKHFSSVRMQQGRVQLDADWNEECEITTHRIDTEAGDVIGLCGAPMHFPAFHIVDALNKLTPEEQNLPENKTAPAGFRVPDFLISAGRYYVDGILCENDSLTSYLNQPDLSAAVQPSAIGLYLVYVDVWQRHLTALDDPSIREVALGGPDTATRTKTVWQVKYFFAGNVAGNCVTKFPDYDKFIAPGNGKLIARTSQEKSGPNPCIVPPSAGYTGLENQLYRVEVHDSGDAFDVTTGGAGELVTRVPNTDNQVVFTGGTWNANDAVEIFSSKAGSDPMNGTLSRITNVNSGSKILTLDINVSEIALDELRLRPVRATYKWSRNNGFLATTIESINVADQEITVHDLGPDDVLGFKEGQWVEIIDDRLELNGLPGQLVQIVEIDRAINLIKLRSRPTALSAQVGGVDKTLHPKLRGWDGVGAIKFHPSTTEDHFLVLESSVQVSFFTGSYKTGDYWTIPARTATADAQSGNIEWPQDSAKKPVAQLPFGVKHHYCRLAMLHWSGTIFDVIEDCRHLFPPITELTSLFYVSGDGQEAMPNNPLPQLLQCGVFNGQWPVPGARVRFQTADDGRLAETIAGLPASTVRSLIVTTGPDGIANCAWRLEANRAKPSQQVEARLLDANGDPLPPIVRFNGNLSIAEQVFYDPRACQTLQGQNTVQKAIDKVADLISLYEVRGNNQEVMPGATLEPLAVLAANRCGPIGGQKVSFKTVGTSGTVNPAEALTDASGIATTVWTLDPAEPRQQVEASLIDEAAPSITAPTTLRFTANLSIASQVSYTPDRTDCPDLAGAGVTTVKEALDELCKRTADEEPGIRIEKILTGDGDDLLNDTLVLVSRLQRGITIVCNRPPIDESVGNPPDPQSQFPRTVPQKPTCFVTLDLPYPIDRSTREFWSFSDNVGDIIGFQPLILASLVDVKENRIQWIPNRIADLWLQTILFDRLTKTRIADRVLAHLTLKGNYIWAQTDREQLYLDGNAFGTLSPAKRIDLRFPTGDRRRGGDFEMWFWLTSNQPTGGIILTVTAITQIDGTHIQGNVRDASGVAIPGAQVAATNTATGLTRTATTDAKGNVIFKNIPGGVPHRVRAQSGALFDEKSITL